MSAGRSTPTRIADHLLVGHTALLELGTDLDPAAETRRRWVERSDDTGSI